MGSAIDPIFLKCRHIRVDSDRWRDGSAGETDNPRAD